MAQHEYDYDLFVIGAGSGGVRASRMAAGLGVKTAVAEYSDLGGTCVNLGCVPKKLLVYASHFSEDLEQAAGFGWDIGQSQFNWQNLITAKNKEIKRLNDIYKNLLDNAGVDLINGKAILVDKHNIRVNDKIYSAKRILIAPGGWPSVPDIKGSEHIITSNQIFHLDQLPQNIIIVGGGYIAVEFAGIFNGLGRNVTQLYRGDMFLRGFDDDIRQFLANEIVKKGIDLKFNSNIAAIEKTVDGYIATLEGDSKINTDMIVYATGRHPRTADLGLENAGVKLAKGGAIIVDDNFKTNIDNIYALGDVIDRVALTPVAIGEAMILVHNIYADRNDKMDYSDIPTAVFSQPEIGTVGLSEAQARKKYGEVDIYKSEFRPMKHTLSGSDERSLMKLIIDKATDKVVGVHMIGAYAGEMMQGIGIAIKAGATKADFDNTIGIHPTSAEEFVTMRIPE